jgi:hypothetical protein
MWNLYSTPGSVAIKINYKVLKEMIAESEDYEINRIEDIEEMTYGSVQYKDFVDSFAVSDSEFKVRKTPFRKDLSFAHEREFRICLRVKKMLGEKVLGLSQVFKEMDKFPIEVVAHPKSTSWHYANLITLLKQFAPAIVIRNSELKFR